MQKSERLKGYNSLKSMNTNGEKISDLFPVILFTVFLAFWCMEAIAPIDRFNWFLENILVILACGVLAITYKTFRFSNCSYLLIAVFLSLHVIGSHYSYAMTPIDSLLKGIFDFGRNNYDRIVHFSFGFLWAYPVLEIIERVAKIKGAWSGIITVVSILSAGAFYELIEMWVAKIVAPEIGLMFLGIQGDIWDTQHDMEVALYGSAIVIGVIMVYRRWRKR